MKATLDTTTKPGSLSSGAIVRPVVGDELTKPIDPDLVIRVLAVDDADGWVDYAYFRNGKKCSTSNIRVLIERWHLGVKASVDAGAQYQMATRSATGPNVQA